MTDLKSCLILILLTKFVETKISPDVRCAVNGDVYLRKSSQRSNLTSRSSEYIFASSETTVCDHQVAGDVLKIHGCVQPGVSSRVDVFLHDGSDSSLHIYRINCLPLVSTRHHETYQAADLSGKDSEYLTYQEPIVGQRRRKDVSGDVNAGNDDDDGIKNLQTSVSFEVKLNFSSNDEISIACNPDNLGILYVSNPDPDQLIYVVSFSELTKQKCNSEFLEGRRFVAVGGCSLNFPITISFNSNDLSSVIGGAYFKVYNVTCSDKASVARGNVFPDRYNTPGSHGTDQCRYSFFVTMVMLAITLMNQLI